MTKRYSTGVTPLDRKLGGGIPPGTVLACFARPASQGELFVGRLAAESETLYLSTERLASAVRSGFHGGSPGADDLAVVALDGDAPLVDAIEHVERVPDRTVVVVDPVGPLERTDPGQFRAFLRTLRSKLTSTDGLGVLYGLKHDDEPAQRHRTEYAADLVFDLVTETDGDTVENYLHVPKFRGGRALTDGVRVELTDRIDVDTSRDIA